MAGVNATQKTAIWDAAGVLAESISQLHLRMDR